MRLGNLLDAHRAERIAQRRERLERERAERERRELANTIVQTWPDPEMAGARYVLWANGETTWCANWEARPADWPSGRW